MLDQTGTRLSVLTDIDKNRNERVPEEKEHHLAEPESAGFSLFLFFLWNRPGLRLGLLAVSLWRGSGLNAAKHGKYPTSTHQINHFIHPIPGRYVSFIKHQQSELTNRLCFCSVACTATEYHSAFLAEIHKQIQKGSRCWELCSSCCACSVGSLADFKGNSQMNWCTPCRYETITVNLATS